MFKKVLIGLAVLIAVLAGLIAAGLYVYPKAQVVSASKQVAPDFTLRDGSGQEFTLSSLRGHKVVLFFYRGYW